LLIITGEKMGKKYTADTMQAGTIAGGHYSQIDKDGLKLFGDATGWEDLNFDVVRSGGPVAQRPDDVTINNVFYKEFTSSNNQSCGDGDEVPHSAKLGGMYYPHLHGFLKSGESAGTTGVTFRINWELRQGASTTSGFIDFTSTSAEISANANKIDFYNGGFTGATELGAHITLSLSRTGGNAGDFIVMSYGIHYEIDTIGSNEITTK
jgi:hypothetical protein